jgi:hypothetical protein
MTLDLTMASWISHKYIGNKRKNRQLSFKKIWTSKDTINRVNGSMGKYLQTIYAMSN